jgi:hypothetical protein
MTTEANATKKRRTDADRLADERAKAAAAKARADARVLGLEEKLKARAQARDAKKRRKAKLIGILDAAKRAVRKGDESSAFSLAKDAVDELATASVP